MKRRLLLWGMLLAAPWTAAGVTYPERPAEGAFLADEARVVSEAQAQEINQIASTLLRDLRIPLFAVTVRSLASHGAAGLTVDAYAQSLFDTWGIGSEQHNYGMLLFVALDDRAARIELGAAWGRSKDADMERIMTSLILPEMRAGRHGAGILAGVRGSTPPHGASAFRALSRRGGRIWCCSVPSRSSSGSSPISSARDGAAGPGL